MELRRYWEIFLRRKWVFLAVFFIIASTVITGAYCLTPAYKATAKVSIETSTALSTLLSLLSVDTKRVSSAPDGAEKYELMGDDVVKATVRPLLRQLIFNLQLRDRDHDLIEPDELIDPSLKKLILPEPYIEVEQYEDTNIIEIAAISSYAEEAMMIANTLADLYIEDQLNQKRAEYGNARKFIQSKIDNERSKYFSLLKSIRDYSTDEKIVDLDTEIENDLTRLSELHESYEQIKLSIADSRASIKKIAGQWSGIKEFRVASSEIEDSSLLQSLKEDLYGYEIELARVSTEFTSDHPNVKQVKSKIEKAKDIIKREPSKIFKSEITEVDPLYDDLAKKLLSEHVNLVSLEAKREAIDESIRRLQEHLMKYPTIAMRQKELKLPAAASETVYSTLLRYLDQIGIAESITLSEIRVIDPAVKPNLLDPYFPKRRLSCFLGFFLGLFWGLIGAFLAEYLDDTIHTSEDLHECKTLIPLGTIPNTRKIKRHLVSDLDPKSRAVEAYRKIRNNLKKFWKGDLVGTLVITSLAREDGKTTTATNLGISVSKEGKNVLIMDLDLRNPGLHKKFDPHNAKGITEYTEEDFPIEDIIVGSGVENLSIIFCGKTPSDPAQIIESQKLKDAIRELSLKYDLIIIDSPPLIIASDALVLGNMVNGLITVAKSGKTTFSLLRYYEGFINGQDLNGVILNKVNHIFSHNTHAIQRQW
jgi:succinoglycan biosynthesis transport protein ExoP